jgi:DNA helicase-2/ATP-dependent DNA helicase PcrA
MNIKKLFDIIESVQGFPLDENQKKVIEHDEGPLWVIAGPGSGKTEVLVVRTLKLIFVDEIDPASIIITTFTEKAAQNLFDRIQNYAFHILESNPDIKVDLHGLNIGTLHKICNDVMLKYRYPKYDNFRLIDDIEQYLFTFEHSDLVTERSNKYRQLWEKFDYLFKRYDKVAESYGWHRNSQNLPNKWRRTDAAMILFNRIVEEMADLNQMKVSGRVWKLLTIAYEDYYNKLEKENRCDFSHLLKKFLEFLNDSLGYLFLNGDANEPGIKYVMVDEYQDTNPIQEAIYFKLTEKTQNLCVVGDDDQALYRFRGGTVDCMVTFDQACNHYFGITTPIEKKFLISNYRSNKKIVEYYDEYINSFDSMKIKGARVENKPSLDPKATFPTDYPPLSYIEGKNTKKLAENFANFVKYLLDNKIIKKPSQCVLLMKSVRENATYAKHFTKYLKDVKIKPYNPRSRKFLEQKEIKVALGAFISIIDPEGKALSTVKLQGIKKLVQDWLNEYEETAHNHSELDTYVKKSVTEIRKKPINKWIKNLNILEIYYRILSQEPFITWKEDPERSYRLGKLSGLFENYSSIPYPNYNYRYRGELKTSKTEKGEISLFWRNNFYHSFIGILTSKGIDDPEDEEIICPVDQFPIMTVHQAKGLEFDFVFVYGLHQYPVLSDSILIEDELMQFRKLPPFVQFSTIVRAEHDLIRFYFVAYSRPKYALIHLVTHNHLIRGYPNPNKDFKNDNKMGFIDKDISLFKQTVYKLGA